MVEANNQKLKVEYVSIDKLTPYANNAKIHTEEQVAQIATSIKQFGNCDPLGVWTNDKGELEIVEGHGRVLALQMLGATTVPVIRLDHLDDAARRAYCHVHNQLTMNTDMDMDTLTRELEALSEFDMCALGFDMDMLEVAETLDHIQEVEVPELNEKQTRVKPGDAYALGRHFLICGDATRETDVDALRALGDGRPFDMVLTDPPYNVGYTGETKDKLTIANDSFKSKSAYQEFLYKAFKSVTEHLKPGGAAYVWYAQTMTIENIAALTNAGIDIKQNLVYIKNNMRIGWNDYHYMHEPCLYGYKPGAAHYFINDRTQKTVKGKKPDLDKLSKQELKEMLEQIYAEPCDCLFANMTLHNDIHPTMKPIKLFSELIRNSSRRGECVVDMFAGSGTTLICCEQLGRTCKALELDPIYADAIICRWETMTGNVATMLGNIYE